MTKSKPGKHGAAKVRLEAIGLFDSKKRVVLKPADAPVDSPIIEKKKAQASCTLLQDVGRKTLLLGKSIVCL